jgi:hypothetical protein
VSYRKAFSQEIDVSRQFAPSKSLITTGDRPLPQRNGGSRHAAGDSLSS